MSTETIARRYASALADVVVKTGESDTVRNEIGTLKELFTSNQDLQNAFSNPAIAHSRKEGLLEGLIDKAKPTKTTSNFLRVLLQNGRLTDLPAINEKFGSVLEERSGLLQAYVTSAHELSEEQKKELKANLDRLTGRTVNLNFKIDPELIGGVVTRIGSTVYDSSVRTKLENLKEELMQK
ncbi:ATP synthase F1 subunit delta [Leptolyngbya sp. 7M]|uniref:ATP synthase F1 subunit delta n=1 Tax=Leptolyngbya sp. 7M TaxID=2812896 RepID=UPI001B8D84E3|nr:ATP synthase F1 subunit delta [Leptolyngbya sp. 7M]QYO61935.1 F0F1 ATP synthase subunit delta [Leptolyngbya sp. 7M]